MVSVIVPVMNEEENIAPLLLEIMAAAHSVPIKEIIYVDDGSTDRTLKVLKSLRNDVPLLRVLTHSKRSGQSSALLTGIRSARSEIIATIDGDGQNNPMDIALLYKAAGFADGTDKRIMVAGQRMKRQDTYIRRVTSRIANRIRSSILKDNTRDTGCSLKMFRKSDFLSLPYFNHMHRFLPALMMREGVTIIHVDVSHRERRHGVSKYGTLDRLMVGITDLLGVRWLQSRANLHPLIMEI